ncbi:hypothetical protein BLA29_014220 [Euroglyphus maynei]|uniref:Uncharacterized protein n=1 Tax=Euroglyphus maynei TaxID=6958 RepID=A0A1Y3BTN9_EURMA|nr:hypothetical protein BLA29_014220 [Euroglyphus maynei]
MIYTQWPINSFIKAGICARIRLMNANIYVLLKRKPHKNIDIKIHIVVVHHITLWTRMISNDVYVSIDFKILNDFMY